ncbi:GntR family transcriptional regulator [Consotaella salsifontis]|uniref:GntR family transcriptional regulator n=1 Tax=Consotaella salsifontis TaxID=1365950 RepID=A0A1T4P5A6_9HYPH|nr:GntR family transcriptional regulator [Consotaella salsifontis]SJZ86780.1 GntR family transcriptional regulator [Consotaella salsifontis]
MQRLTVRPAQAVQELLQAYIRREGLRPGDRLPAERELAERWGVSRGALRAAIRTLSEEQVLSQRHGAGTFVATPRVLRNLRDLRPFTQVVSDAGRTVRTEVLHCTAVDAHMQLADRLDLDPGERVWHLRRRRFIDGQPAAVEDSYLGVLRFPALDEQVSADRSLYDMMSESYGIDVDCGYQRLEASAADQADAELLELPVGEAVFRLTGVADDANGAPVEFFTSRVRADLVAFASTLDVARV